MGQWLEIFSGGMQTAVDGKTYDGNRLIDAAVATFDPAYHEPPVVLGEMRHDAPAAGWVDAVRKTVRHGAVILEAKLRNLIPELQNMIDSGAQKPKVSFYGNGRLRHYVFLHKQVACAFTCVRRFTTLFGICRLAGARSRIFLYDKIHIIDLLNRR